MGTPDIGPVKAEYDSETANKYDNYLEEEIKKSHETTESDLEDIKIAAISKTLKENIYSSNLTISTYQFTDQESYTDTDFTDKTDTYVNMNSSFRYIRYNIGGAGTLYNQLAEGNDFKKDSPKKVFESIKSRLTQLGFNKKVDDQGKLVKFDIQNDQDMLYAIGFFQTIVESKVTNASKKDFRIGPKTLTALLDNTTAMIAASSKPETQTTSEKPKNIQDVIDATEIVDRTAKKTELEKFSEATMTVKLYSRVEKSDYEKLFAAVAATDDEEKIKLAYTYMQALIKGDQSMAGATDDKKYPGIKTFKIICQNLWQEAIYQETKDRLDGKVTSTYIDESTIETKNIETEEIEEPGSLNIEPITTPQENPLTNEESNTDVQTINTAIENLQQKNIDPNTNPDEYKKRMQEISDLQEQKDALLTPEQIQEEIKKNQDEINLLQPTITKENEFEINSKINFHQSNITQLQKLLDQKLQKTQPNNTQPQGIVF